VALSVKIAHVVSFNWTLLEYGCDVVLAHAAVAGSKPYTREIFNSCDGPDSKQLLLKY
jgi:hypothetical protein